jgi:hypothetical protein
MQSSKYFEDLPVIRDRLRYQIIEHGVKIQFLAGLPVKDQNFNAAVG